jgi:hypothetical protein
VMLAIFAPVIPTISKATSMLFEHSINMCLSQPAGTKGLGRGSPTLIGSDPLSTQPHMEVQCINSPAHDIVHTSPLAPSVPRARNHSAPDEQSTDLTGLFGRASHGFD